MKLQYFFYDKTTKTREPKFKIPSKWMPKEIDIDDHIIEILNELEKELEKINLCNRISKSSLKEIRLLKNLKKDSNIIVKPADKGNSIIIQNRANYTKEAYRQLSNPLHYRKISKPVSIDDHEKISELLTKLKENKYITKKEFEHTQPDPEARPRLIYFTPKIHKNQTTWPTPNIPAGRPIVSDVGSDTYNVSELIDYYLAPLANKHPSYIKDTPHFIEKIRKTKIPKNAFLITLDVESLYTNINKEQGLEAIKILSEKYPMTNRPDEEMLELIDICLNNNDFKFEDNWFVQTYGTAMGKKFSPHYADIFMAVFESQALKKCKFKPFLYFRFLDDIFLIWTYTLDLFQKFLDVFNNHSATIKFKANIDFHTITFLDVQIYKGKQFQTTNILDTKVHFKDTDTHELLHKQSFHPPHTFKGILKGQIIRFSRICSNNQDMITAVKTVFPILYQRAYGIQFTRNVYFNTVKQIKEGANTKQLITKCQSTKCGLHKYLKPLVEFKYNNNAMLIKDQMNCASKNVIYAIRCTLCRLVYIGQTSKTLRERFQGHKSTILLDKNKLLAKHINTCMKTFKHTDKENLPLTITPIAKIEVNEDKLTNILNLMNRESEIITNMKTSTPHGINGPQDTQSAIPVTLKYSDKTKHIATLFRNYHTELRKAFPKIFKRDFILAHIKNTNITDYLVRAELSPLGTDG